MPRNIRNFWIESTVDGVATKYASGPKAKDGGFELTIKQRVKGNIVTAYRISGIALQTGELSIQVANGSSGRVLDESTSER